MDRIAIISDIHSNLEALKTVLKDIEKRGITRIFCLGDIIHKGVNHRQCLDLVKEYCEVILRGNCDEYFSKEHENLDEYSETERNRILWNHSILNDEQRKYLLNLPYCFEFYMSGSLIRLFHATPEKIDGFISNLDSIEKKRSLFMPSSNTITQNIADIVIYGHLHAQYLERIYNRTLVNVGSVGNPIDTVRNDNFDSDTRQTTQANYLIIEGNYGSQTYDDSISFQFIKVPYDIAKELSSEINNPEKEDYEVELTKGKYRDMKKLVKSFKERNIDMDKF